MGERPISLAVQRPSAVTFSIRNMHTVCKFCFVMFWYGQDVLLSVLQLLTLLPLPLLSLFPVSHCCRYCCNCLICCLKANNNKPQCLITAKQTISNISVYTFVEIWLFPSKNILKIAATNHGWSLSSIKLGKHGKGNITTMPECVVLCLS